MYGIAETTSCLDRVFLREMEERKCTCLGFWSKLYPHVARAQWTTLFAKSRCDKLDIYCRLDNIYGLQRAHKFNLSHSWVLGRKPWLWNHLSIIDCCLSFPRSTASFMCCFVCSAVRTERVSTRSMGVWQLPAGRNRWNGRNLCGQGLQRRRRSRYSHQNVEKPGMNVQILTPKQSIGFASSNDLLLLYVLHTHRITGLTTFPLFA